MNDPTKILAGLVYQTGDKCYFSDMGYHLQAEREWAKLRLKSHFDNPEKCAKPLCIIRLKEWK